MSLPRKSTRYQKIRRVTLIGSAVDLLLGVVKLVVGWFAQSQALMADGFHSLSDLATDFGVLVAAKHAQREADEDHPYGHARIETVATVALGIVLVLVAAGIAVDAVRRMFNPELLLRPGIWALLVAATSVVAKEWIYRYTVRAARRLRSDLLTANAWHSRSDAISSVIVIVGVSGSMAGLDYVDAVAAVLVAAMIAKIGTSFAWRSVRELIDTGLDRGEVREIRDTIMSVDGVATLHMLRTRKMGTQALVDVHIILNDPRMSVSEGHQISETVRARLIDSIEDVADVMVHIDPEDDEASVPNESLPLRDEALARLHRCWESIDAASTIARVNLHYLSGQIYVEVELPVTEGTDPRRAGELESEFNQSIASDRDFAEVRLLFVG